MGKIVEDTYVETVYELVKKIQATHGDPRIYEIEAKIKSGIPPTNEDLDILWGLKTIAVRQFMEVTFGN